MHYCCLCLLWADMEGGVWDCSQRNWGTRSSLAAMSRGSVSLELRTHTSKALWCMLQKRKRKWACTFSFFLWTIIKHLINIIFTLFILLYGISEVVGPVVLLAYLLRFRYVTLELTWLLFKGTICRENFASKYLLWCFCYTYLKTEL